MFSDIASFCSQQGKNFLFVNGLFFGNLFFFQPGREKERDLFLRVFRKVNPLPTGAAFFVGTADRIDSTHAINSILSQGPILYDLSSSYLSCPAIQADIR